jgi:hypothetical protein
MASFTTTILQFEEKGEKTGWTYIEVPAAIARAIKPGNKKSFRVKGRLDNFPVKGVALLPMGDGNFIIPFNAAMRKGTGKRKGGMVTVTIEEDKQGFQINKDLVACLNDEPEAMGYFNSLPQSHKNYFSKWIESAKTTPTKTKRIALSVDALSKQMGYGEMMREQKLKKGLL